MRLYGTDVSLRSASRVLVLASVWGAGVGGAKAGGKAQESREVWERGGISRRQWSRVKGGEGESQRRAGSVSGKGTARQWQGTYEVLRRRNSRWGV
ncbi:hypothetical protein XELAEV_18001756mg [Xenopus laevis]|uniref:Uncharacterized protein n=1 Tax=Xenopus laevis TaxID=8355 RepID=A0A974BNX7_XENLA|nr:hypothetical protein XELAEV_18001756mg [Xenopus laevis]